MLLFVAIFYAHDLMFFGILWADLIKTPSVKS